MKVLPVGVEPMSRCSNTKLNRRLVGSEDTTLGSCDIHPVCCKDEMKLG